MMSPELRRVYVWEFPVRLFHWINVLCLFTLAGTGLLIGSPLALMNSGEAWAGYWFGWLRFIHFTAAYLLLANLLLRLYWAWAGNPYARWKEYLPVTGQDWRDLVKTLRVYLLIDRWPGDARAGHNRLQGLTYLAITVLTFFMVFTGFGMYSAMSAAWIPKAFAWVVPLMGGDLVVRRWHHMALWAFVVFLVIHIYLDILNDRQDRQGLFSSIITGWKVVAKR
ncbi:MAG: Ni/Fe-hydrogenase, b-type cytochrome subunit [SAR324 cluster bacterium]